MQKIKRIAFSDTQVKERLETMVVVWAMREDRKALSDFPYVKWVLTIFFVTPNHEINQTITGYFDASDF